MPPDDSYIKHSKNRFDSLPIGDFEVFSQICFSNSFYELISWALPKGTFTHTQAEAGAKSALQEMGPTPNFPRPLRNRALQTISVLKKWQIRPRPLGVCVNIPSVAERECQNPPVSAPQPLRACVNAAFYKFYFQQYIITTLCLQATCHYLSQCWVKHFKNSFK